MIAIIDSGGANLTSIIFALQRLNVNPRLTVDRKVIKRARHIILPGVGTAHDIMNNLIKLNLCQTIRELVQPVLGICLGMQLFYDYSCEGDVECLGIISGKVVKLTAQEGIYIPHMGWNKLKIIEKSPLLRGIKNDSYVYFVHSFAASISKSTIATCQHGVEFSAICKKQNFYGVQFHPERSGIVGAKILKNFLQL